MELWENKVNRNYLKPHLKWTACDKNKGGWIDDGLTMSYTIYISNSVMVMDQTSVEKK